MDFHDSRTATAGRKRRIREVDEDKNPPRPTKSPSSEESDGTQARKRSRLANHSLASSSDIEDATEHFESDPVATVRTRKGKDAPATIPATEKGNSRSMDSSTGQAVKVPLSDRILQLRKSLDGGVPKDMHSLINSGTGIIVRFIPATNSKPTLWKGVRPGKGKRKKCREDEAAIQILSQPIAQGLKSVTFQDSGESIAIVLIYKTRSQAEGAAQTLQPHPIPQKESLNRFALLRTSALMTVQTCQVSKGPRQLCFDGVRFDMKEWRQCPNIDRLAAFIKEYGVSDDQYSYIRHQPNLQDTIPSTDVTNNVAADEDQEAAVIDDKGEFHDILPSNSAQGERNETPAHHAPVSGSSNERQETQSLFRGTLSDAASTPLWRTFNRAGMIGSRLSTHYNLGCYNCGANEHWGDDCPQLELDHLVQSQTFSHIEASRYLLPLAQSGLHQRSSMPETNHWSDTNATAVRALSETESIRPVNVTSRSSLLPVPVQSEALQHRSAGSYSHLPGGPSRDATRPDAPQDQYYGKILPVQDLDSYQTSHYDRERRSYDSHRRQDRYDTYPRY